MSLSRLALRVAAVHGLATPDDTRYPTLAAELFYDSRIDPLAGDDALAAIEGRPLVILYTEKDDKRPYDAAAHRYPAREQEVHLVAELMIAARGAVEVTMADGSKETVGTLEAPISDRQHEALLDILEAQIAYRLEKNRGFAAMQPFFKVAMELRAVDSVPQRADDRVTRLAARTVTYRFKVRAEDWDGRAPGALPAPLSFVAAALPEGSSGAEVCALAFSAMPDAPPPPAPSPAAALAIFAADGRVPTQTSDGSPDADLTARIALQSS